MLSFSNKAPNLLVAQTKHVHELWNMRIPGQKAVELTWTNAVTTISTRSPLGKCLANTSESDPLQNSKSNDQNITTFLHLSPVLAESSVSKNTHSIEAGVKDIL